MALTITTVEPDFIEINYDVSGNQLRKEFRDIIKRYGGVYVADSHYRVLFTVGLFDELSTIAQKYGRRIRAYITTPAYPTDQALLLKEDYEKRFVEQYDVINENLAEIKLMMDGQRVKVIEKMLGMPPKTRPYTAREIIQRLSYVTYELESAQVALIRRKEREQKDWQLNSNKQKQMELLEQKIDQMRSQTHLFKEECDRRKKVEDNNVDLEVKKY